MKTILILALAALISGCATSASPQAQAIKDADATTVTACTYVGDVTGTSGVGGLRAATGIENAKNAAREKASAMGATHIVWGSVQGGFGPSVAGKAYKCGQ